MDDWILATSEHTPRWIATLSDGSDYYQDDGRPGTCVSAWIRLKEYCAKESVHIVGIRLNFRSHTETKAEYHNADGYWFRNGAMYGVGMKKTFQYYLLGVVRGGKLYVDRWKVPEILLDESDVRDIDIEDDTFIMR